MNRIGQISGTIFRWIGIFSLFAVWTLVVAVSCEYNGEVFYSINRFGVRVIPYIIVWAIPVILYVRAKVNSRRAKLAPMTKSYSGHAVTVGLLCIFFGILSVGFYQGNASSKRIKALRNSLDTDLHAALAVGDDTERIERVLNEKNIQYDYEEFMDGYISVIRTERSVEKIVVILSVDKAKKLREISVKMEYK